MTRPATLIHDCLIDEAGGEIVREDVTGYITIEGMEKGTFILAPGSHLEDLFIAPRYPGWTWYRIRPLGPVRRFLLRLIGIRRSTRRLTRWRT